MDALSSIEAIIRDLLIFVVAMTALLIALLVIVSRMPDDNPLKRILVALSYRVGATAAAGLLAAPAIRSPASTRWSTSARRSCSYGTGGRSSAACGLTAPEPRRPPGSDRRSATEERGFLMGFQRANGGVIHYRDEGRRSGRVLVFINALGSDLRIWDEVAAALANDFRLIRYDKRGHGLSEAGPDRYDMSDYARDLAGLLDALDVTRATIVGLSIGGLIAQDLYRQRPSLFAGLVLSDTAAKIGDDAGWDARITAIESGGVEAVADGVLQRWFTADFRSSRADDLTGWRAMLVRTPKQGYLAACGALKRADLRSFARRASPFPTLCLVGDEDGSTPVALVRETADLIADSRFEIIAGAATSPGSRSPTRPPGC